MPPVESYSEEEALKDEEILKKAIMSLTEILMQKLEQNRVVIVFSDETIMVENNTEIDPTIKL